MLVKPAWGGADQRVERMRQSEYQMEIRHRQDFSPPCCQPRLLGTGLAARAMPVAAGMIDVPARPAIGAGFDMAAERCRATGKNGPPDLGRTPRQRLAGQIGRTEGGEHLGQAGRCHAGGSVWLKEFEG